MTGRLSREKGLRIEREIVELHRELGLRCERVPLSGATGYRGLANDLDIYVDGPDSAPLIAEVKARASGTGFKVLEKMLGDSDLLVLRRDRAKPLVLLPWHTWERLLRRR